MTLDGDIAFNWIQVQFEAAHQLPHVPAGHKCGRLHGHGFGVRLAADAELSDHARLEAAWLPLFGELNHRYLNDIAGLDNPTSEVLAQWLHQRLADTLPGLAWVEVRETHSAGVSSTASASASGRNSASKAPVLSTIRAPTPATAIWSG